MQNVYIVKSSYKCGPYKIEMVFDSIKKAEQYVRARWDIDFEKEFDFLIDREDVH